MAHSSSAKGSGVLGRLLSSAVLAVVGAATEFVAPAALLLAVAAVDDRVSNIRDLAADRTITRRALEGSAAAAARVMGRMSAAGA